MLLPIQGEADWETKRFAKNSWKLTGQCNWSLVKAANSSVYNSENHRMCFAVLRWWSWTFFASSTKYSRNSRSRSEWNRQFRFIRPFLLICVADSLNLRYAGDFVTRPAATQPYRNSMADSQASQYQLLLYIELTFSSLIGQKHTLKISTCHVI